MLLPRGKKPWHLDSRSHRQDNSSSCSNQVTSNLRSAKMVAQVASSITTWAQQHLPRDILTTIPFIPRLLHREELHNNRQEATTSCLFRGNSNSHCINHDQSVRMNLSTSSSRISLLVVKELLSQIRHQGRQSFQAWEEVMNITSSKSSLQCTNGTLAAT